LRWPFRFFRAAFCTDAKIADARKDVCLQGAFSAAPLD
jgi:hypothetical protein